ncbi:hypothetical protein GCM10023196_091960 [Actinoallomurus vinaceus]|uniref:Uncharacterized protein n=1 Tax=Actinoallomurus vinaceus TaxID=1080074 RepID=A0ABP8UQT4_9ACTN
MANRSFLLVGDYDGINPGWRGDIPGLEHQVLAEDVYCVPLLWLAMFRPADLVTETFPPEDEEDGPIEATAPLAPKERALAQLDAALPALNRIFDGAGRLDDHAALLREGVASMPGRSVTIELYEIAVLIDDEQFYQNLRAGLGSLDQPGDLAADRSRLTDLAQLREGRPFPPARLVLDGLDAPDDDDWNHTRLLGTCFLRPVPWETAVDTPA